MAGWREEWWRAGRFTALAALYPPWLERWPGKLAATAVVALIQGAVAVIFMNSGDESNDWREAVMAALPSLLPGVSRLARG